MLICISALQRADDRALATRLSVVAQDVRETIEARARLGLNLRYMADLQPLIERERSASPGIAAITIHSKGRVVLFSTDRVTGGDEANRNQVATAWTHVDSDKVTVGLPIMNSFSERLGDVEVSAMRSGLDVAHLQPLAILGMVASTFFALSAALAWLGSLTLLHPVQRSVRAVTADASRAFTLIHAPPSLGRGDAPRQMAGPLVTASPDVLGIIRDATHDIARMDEAEL
jgi:hypothetical protein